MKKKINLYGRKKYYLAYTGLFFFLFFCCFEFFLLKYHKSAMRIWDTYDMHYMEFLYFGKWVRTALTQFRFPVWDPSIGYGADFFLTMNGFVCDPLNWISVITPAKYAEFGMLFTIFVKLYFAGLAFMYFGFHKKGEPYAVLCGSLLYTFSACAYLGFYQAMFINPMYAFPLLLVGTDRLFEENNPKLYVAVLTYSALCSFYVTYMVAILIIMYCIIKWIFLDRELRTKRRFAVVFCRMFIYSLWAAAIAAFTLVPMAIFIMNMSRLDLPRFVPMLYDRSFYENMFKGFIAHFDMQGRDCKIGFSTLALMCVFLLFTTESGKHRQQKIEFLLMSLGLLLPIVGHVMNAFGYVANRWVWAYALLVSYIAVIMLPRLRTMSAAQWYGLMLFAGLYVFLAYEFCRASGRAFITLSILLGFLCLTSFELQRLPQKQFERLIVSLSCLTVMIPAFYYYCNRYGNSFANNIEAGDALDKAMDSGGLPLLTQIDTSDGSRYNRHGLEVVRNASWIYGVGGMDFYMNMYNDSIDRFHNSMALNTSPWSFGYNSLDRRSELLALMGVDHFFTPAENPYKPVTFTEQEATADGREGSVVSWKPEKDYGLFSRFTQAVSEEDFQHLDPFSRQQLIMKAIVTDEDYVTSKASDLILSDYQLPYQLEEGDLLTVNGRNILVYDAWAELTLRFQKQQNVELYLYFDNIQYNKGLATDYSVRVYGFDGDYALIHGRNSFDALTNIHHMYGGKHNWLLNLGVIDEEIDRIVILFSGTGYYSLDGIKLFAKDVNEIRANMLSLNQDVDNIRIAPNVIQVDVTNEEQEFLFAAIPYSNGWQAYDNGKRIHILNADVGFMALPLEPGTHTVTFEYHTPGLLTGTLISIISVAGFVSYLKLRRRRAAQQCESAPNNTAIRTIS